MQTFVQTNNTDASSALEGSLAGKFLILLGFLLTSPPLKMASKCDHYSQPNVLPEMKFLDLGGELKAVDPADAAPPDDSAAGAVAVDMAVDDFDPTTELVMEGEAKFVSGENNGKLAEQKVKDMLPFVYPPGAEGTFPEGQFDHSLYYRNILDSDSLKAVPGKPKILNGEIDFFVVDRKRGLILVEVKSGTKLPKNASDARAQLGKFQDYLKAVFDYHMCLENEMRPPLKQLKQKPTSVLAFPLQYKKYLSADVLELITTRFGEGSVLFAEDFESGESFVESWTTVRSLCRTQELDDATYQQLCRTFIVSPQKHITFHITSGEKVITMLTEKQCKLMQSHLRKLQICGPAGSGKTEILVAKINKLRETNPTDRILVLTYNRPMCCYLQLKLGLPTGLDDRSLSDDLLVCSFDTFQKLQRDATKRQVTEPQVDTAASLFAHAFVDEGQEIIHQRGAHVLSDVLDRCVDPNGFRWIVIGGKEQIIPHGKGAAADRDPYLDESNYPLFMLREVVRCNHAVREQFMKFAPAEQRELAAKLSLSSKPIPELPVACRMIPFKTRARQGTGKMTDQLRGAASSLLKEALEPKCDFKPEHIAILVNNGHSVVKVITALKLVPWFKESGIRFTDAESYLHLLSEREQLRARDMQQLQFDAEARMTQIQQELSSTVIVESVRCFRGLERPLVIVVDSSGDADEASFMYTALSRGSQCVWSVTAPREVSESVSAPPLAPRPRDREVSESVAAPARMKRPHSDDSA